MDNHNIPHKRYAKTLLLLGALLALASPTAFAAELGMNYYHESMMGTWGGAYLPRTDSEISSDLDDIKSVTRYIKLYANPLVDGNVAHAKRIAEKAKAKGMHVTVAMNTEDRELNDGNWGDYKNRVNQACRDLDGTADEFIVGNEIGLHSPWDTWGIRSRVEGLMNECSFGGQKSYEAFFWDRDAWKDSDKRIYLNMYEHYDLFSQNMDELDSWRVTPHIGEWGDNFGSEDDQKHEIERRWNKIEQSPVDRAYVFTYKEPSTSGTFGLLRNDGAKKPAWYALPTSTQTTKTQTSTQTWTAPSSDWNIGQLRATMTADGGSWQKQDTAMGDCRVFVYGTNAGDAKILACKKGDAVEMYRQQNPSTSWKFTLGSGSIGSQTGFAHFIPSTQGGQTSTAPTSTTVQSTFSGIGALSVSFESGAGSWQLEDSTSGDCRTLRYGTGAGDAKVLACLKGDTVEMYRQQNPSTNWRLTLDSHSIGSHTGFVTFTPTGGSDGGDSNTHTPAATTPSSGNGWSATPNGRLVKHEDQGTCELAAFDTDAGYIEALACDKGGAWEMYLKSSPNGAQISYGGGTLGSNSGFTRW